MHPSQARENLLAGDYLTIQDTESGAYQAEPQDRSPSGWLHATIRLHQGILLLLTGPHRTRTDNWTRVGLVRGDRFSLNPTVLATLDSVQRYRLVLAIVLMAELGYETPLASEVQDAIGRDQLLDMLTAPGRFRLSRAFPCEECGKTLTAGISTDERTGPVCGGRVKPARTWKNIQLDVAMGHMPECRGTCDPTKYCADCGA